MKALKKNSTLELVELLKGKKKVNCKCVFIVKHKANDYIERYKTRLVTRAIHKPMGYTTMKHLHMWQRSILSESYYPWQQTWSGPFNSFMSRMPFFMKIRKRKCIWTFLLALKLTLQMGKYVD